MEMFSKSKDIFFSNFNKICRTCIKTITEPLHQIFDSEVVILNESMRTCELLIAVSTLKIHPDDDFPKGICIQCLDSLTKAYNFQKMCILSDLCMRSAILPAEPHVSSQEAALMHNSKKLDSATIFEPCVQNLITPNSINILYADAECSGVEKIFHSHKTIVSKPITQSDVLPNEDINGIQILLLPAESDLIQHSEQSMIIPSEVNSNINMFPSEPPSINHVDHLSTRIVIPSEINSNINIFPNNPQPIGHVDHSDEAIGLKPCIQTPMLSSEPKTNFTNGAQEEVPPWKRGTQIQSFKSRILEPCVQSVIVPIENKSINIFPTEPMVTSHVDQLNVTNVSESCMQPTNILTVKKNVKGILPKESVHEKSDLVQHSDEIKLPKGNEQSSVDQRNISSTNNLLANSLSPEVKIGQSEEITSKMRKTSEYEDNDDNDVDDNDDGVDDNDDGIDDNDVDDNDVDDNNDDVDDNDDDVDDNDDDVDDNDNHDDEKSNIHNNLQAIKYEINSADETIVTKTKETADHDDFDDKSKIFVDVEDLIHTNVVDSKVTKKELIDNTSQYEESNNESMNPENIEEDVDNGIEANSYPVFREIEKPNPRTKKYTYFTCETCGKTFDREHRLHRHMNLHKKEGRPFECEYCRRRFVQEAHLQRHYITHEKTFLEMIETKQNVDGYQCPECPRKFLKQESLASHMRTHRKDIDALQQFKCEICSKVFERLYRLTRHRQLHEGNRKYNCDICGKKFGLSSHLVDHLNMHSGIKPHVCDYCQKSFQQACTLKDHLRTHTGEQPFLCAECGKTFNNASNLRQHHLRHSGIKRYQCPECPSKFTCKSGLFSHKTTHRNQKPYECGTCGSRFTKNYSLKKHERIHTGERPYKCDYCEMRFNSSDHMKRHMRTHTGEKPYKCKYCERKFAQSNDMIKHLRSHLGENIYKCEECDASFRLNTELKKHISEHYKAQVKDKTKNNISKKE